MKIWKKALSLLLALALLAAALPFTALAAEGGYVPEEAVAAEYPEETDGGFSLRSAEEDLENAAELFTAPAPGTGSFYEQLNTRAKACYEALSGMTLERITDGQDADGYLTLSAHVEGAYGLRLAGSFDAQRKFTLSSTSEPVLYSLYTDLLSALVAYRFDHPEVFWASRMRYGYQWSKVNSTSVKVTGITYGFEMVYGGRETEMAAEMEEAVQQLLLEIDQTADRYTQVKAAHDLLAARNIYAEGELDDNSKSLSHTAYSALVENSGASPVCDGYSKAFKVLCDRLEIPCVLAVSENHMWNNVKMDDGEWYNLDLTWDDAGDEVSHTYFLIGSQTKAGLVPFCEEPEHREQNPYTAPAMHSDVSLSYPEKNRKAYEYQGGNYPPLTFPDVKRSAWYYETVETAYRLNLFGGNNEGLFEPDRKITRAEFAKVMAALLGADLSGYGGASYTDVAETAWYAPAVAWAKENGVMNGYGDTFRPDAPITREEMCKVFFNILSPNLESPASGTFQDDRAISGWAREAVYYCSGLGLIQGDEHSRCNPGSSTLRSEAATVFVRCSKLTAA